MGPHLEAQIGYKLRRKQELMLAILMMLLGIQLTITPGEVFKVGGPLQPYTFAPALFWTLTLTVLGTARVVIVIINGVWRPSPTARWWLSTAGTLVWGSIAFGYMWMLPTTKGFPALMFSPVVLMVEADCLIALSALRQARLSGA